MPYDQIDRTPAAPYQPSSHALPDLTGFTDAARSLETARRRASEHPALTLADGAMLTITKQRRLLERALDSVERTREVLHDGLRFTPHEMNTMDALYSDLYDALHD